MDSVNKVFRPNTTTSAPDTASARIAQRFQHESAVTNARMLIENVHSNCFERCVPRPGSSLSKGEELCMTQCMEKYMAAWNAVSKEYLSRMQREHDGVSIR